MVFYEGAIIDRPETVGGGRCKADSISPVSHTASEVAVTLSQFTLRETASGQAIRHRRLCDTN